MTILLATRILFFHHCWLEKDWLEKKLFVKENYWIVCLAKESLFFFFELATITLYIFLSFSFFLSSFFFPSSVFLRDSSIQLVIIVQTAFANVANSPFYEPCLHSESINMDPSRRRVWEDPDERFNLHSRDCVYDSPLSPRCRGNNVASLEICD